MSTHQQEIARGERFEFGANWQRFISQLDERRIAAAEDSLLQRLGLQDLQGRRFVDVGSGSGLFSLAARRLGATVHSFDYDPQSVACTRELKQRYFPADSRWVVESGSVLDADYLKALGQWDIVYSWGVLHHTGDQWRALDHVAQLAADGGSCSSRCITTRVGAAAPGPGPRPPIARPPGHSRRSSLRCP